MLILRDLHKRNAVLTTAYAATAILTGALLLAGCSAASSSTSGMPSPTWSNTPAIPKDADAFATLERVAPPAARLQSGSHVEGTECWTPSQHLLDDPSTAPAGVWRVLCRVHYRLADAARYTDVVCIGDFDKQPMLDHCYIWKPHLGNPTFEDGAKLASPAPSPNP